MNQSRGFLFLGLVLALLYGCVEPYDPKIDLTAEVLIVDGNLTDLAEKQVITISRSRVFDSGYNTTVAVTGASVWMMLDGKQKIILKEMAKGMYQPADGFHVQKGVGYQLYFTLNDGTNYASGIETLPTGVPIDNLYDRFDAKGIANATRTEFTPANLIYVDLNDPAGEANFYRWQWKLWERQGWCASCTGSLYMVSDSACRKTTFPSTATYDYNCSGACWDILSSADFNIFKDTYSNGTPINGHLAAVIPYYQPQPALVEIRQFALSKGAYQYYRIFQNQTQNTGTLTDTPPAPIVGNITNLADETESVVGYFSVSSVAVKRYWLDRKNATGSAIGPDLFEAINKRFPNLEPEGYSPLSGSRPPMARCLLSDKRTPTKPEGWQN